MYACLLLFLLRATFWGIGKLSKFFFTKPLPVFLEFLPCSHTLLLRSSLHVLVELSHLIMQHRETKRRSKKKFFSIILFHAVLGLLISPEPSNSLKSLSLLEALHIFIVSTCRYLMLKGGKGRQEVGEKNNCSSFASTSMCYHPELADCIPKIGHYSY